MRQMPRARPFLLAADLPASQQTLVDVKVLLLALVSRFLLAAGLPATPASRQNHSHHWAPVRGPASDPG